MKRLLLSCVTMVLMLAAMQVSAQDRTVSGRVTSAEDGSALPGVSVVLKGTAIGTQTDGDGRYSLSIPSAGGTITFSFIGLKNQDVAVTSQSTVDIIMETDVATLNEVVVTALGVSTEVKKIPYAAQTVSSDRLNLTRSNNINDALAGKVAGVQLRGQSGAALGRNSQIRIRGAGSFVDKEPLYVVDGTPVTNSNDFNPDDVENITILKGPNATALYGQRGDAGVVVVTLKKGSKTPGIGISLTQNMFFENVYVLPRYQNSYAGGAYSDLAKFTWQDGMPAEWQPLDGKYYHDYTDDASWGPRMTGQEYIPWYAWLPGTKYTGKTAKLKPQPNNVRDFYETGVNRTTNLSFSKANDVGNYRLSYTNQDQTGIMPNTSMQKNTVATAMSVKLNKLVTVGANVNYVNTVLNGEYDDQYSNQSTGSFNQWFHRDVEMDKLREFAKYRSPGGRLTSWNHFNPDYYLAADPETGIKGDKFYRGYYWHNPYSYFELIDYKTTRNRLFGDINVAFNILDNLTAKITYRKNQNTVYVENKRPSILPYSFYTENRPTSAPQWDYYGTQQTFFKEDNVEMLLTYNERFLDDKLSVDLLGGGNIRTDVDQLLSAQTNLGLAVPDLFTISNSKQTLISANTRSEKKVRSLFFQGNIGWNDMLYLTFSGRNDWSSALPANNNSYFYPMVGLSFDFSTLTADALPFLSFGKVRASVAQVGSDLGAYQTALTYGLNAGGTWNGNVLSGTPDTQIDPNIKPSLSNSFEAGLDLKFFTNRIGISATYLLEDKTDEILSVGISGASGFTNRIINAGSLERKGIEIQLDATPVQIGDFRWDATLNFAKIKSTIVELAPGVTAIPAGTGAATFNGAITYHVEGKEWGQLRGYKIARLEDGTPILNSSGLYTRTATPVDYGSVLPDFTGGFINNVSYKRFMLAFNIDFQKGGQFFSLSDNWGTFSGLTERTAGLNDLGNPKRDPVSEGGGVHVVGVYDADASAEGTDYQPIDTYVDAQNYYHQFYNNNIAEPHVYPLTFVKLREISLGYQIPVQNIGLGKVFTSASVSVVGRNLWLIYSKVKDFDPAEISGAFGENGQFPSTRSYGFNIKLSF